MASDELYLWINKPMTNHVHNTGDHFPIMLLEIYACEDIIMADCQMHFTTSQ